MKVTPTASQQPICAKKRALPVAGGQMITDVTPNCTIRQ